MNPYITVAAWIALAVAFTSAIIIAVDELRRPQHMAIMNFVWPSRGCTPGR